MNIDTETGTLVTI